MKVPLESIGRADEAGPPSDGDLDGANRSVLARIDSVVGAFDDEHSELSLHELTQRTELPKSTVHRLVEQLVRMGWLERGVEGYRIGMRLFEIGGLATRARRLVESAAPHLNALAASTGLAVQLGILDGTDVVYLERIATADFALPTREGGRQPAYCTALGKAMLAFDPVATAEVLAQDLPQRTRRTLVSAEALRADLERTKVQGVAYDHQESYDGLACVAAPVRGAGRAVAAVSVTGPVARIDLHAVAPLVQMAAQAIWADRFRKR